MINDYLYLTPPLIDAINHDDVDRFHQVYIRSNLHNNLLDAIISDLCVVDVFLRSKPTLVCFCIFAGARNITKFLIVNGADLNISDQKGRLPIHFAAASGCIDIFIDISNITLDIGAVDRFNRNALHYAAEYGCYEIVNYIYTQGFDICSRHYRGWTPLHFSAWNNSYNVAEFLLNNGVDPDIVANNGETPLQFALYHHFNNLASLLLEHGANPEGIPNSNRARPIIWCAKSDNVEGIKILLSYHIDIESVNEYHETALEVSLRSNKLHAAEFLLQKGAKINIDAQHLTNFNKRARDLIVSHMNNS